MSLETARAAAAEQHADVEVREDPVQLIYSFAGTDLIARPKANPGIYVVLTDVPTFDYKAGDVKVLTPPLDHAAACTARDLANSL